MYFANSNQPDVDGSLLIFSSHLVQCSWHHSSESYRLDQLSPLSSLHGIMLSLETDYTGAAAATWGVAPGKIIRLACLTSRSPNRFPYANGDEKAQTLFFLFKKCDLLCFRRFFSKKENTSF